MIDNCNLSELVLEMDFPHKWVFFYNLEEELVKEDIKTKFSSLKSLNDEKGDIYFEQNDSEKQKLKFLNVEKELNHFILSFFSTMTTEKLIKLQQSLSNRIDKKISNLESLSPIDDDTESIELINDTYILFSFINLIEKVVKCC